MSIIYKVKLYPEKKKNKWIRELPGIIKYDYFSMISEAQKN